MNTTKTPERHIQCVGNFGRSRPIVNGAVAVPLVDALRMDVERLERRLEAARDDLRRYMLSHGEKTPEAGP